MWYVYGLYENTYQMIKNYMYITSWYLNDVFILCLDNYYGDVVDYRMIENLIIVFRLMVRKVHTRKLSN